MLLAVIASNQGTNCPANVYILVLKVEKAKLNVDVLMKNSVDFDQTVPLVAYRSLVFAQDACGNVNRVITVLSERTQKRVKDLSLALLCVLPACTDRNFTNKITLHIINRKLNICVTFLWFTEKLKLPNSIFKSIFMFKSNELYVYFF